MLRNNPVRPGTITLMWVAVILVIALGAVAYIQLAPAAPRLSVYAGNPVSPSNAPVSVSVKPNTNSVYVSNQTLENWIEYAHERHQTSLMQKYQNIIDGRYALRVGAPY